ncbi:hypothetical protein H4R19_003697, partial [Coemansia spiralis]
MERRKNKRAGQTGRPLTAFPITEHDYADLLVPWSMAEIRVDDMPIELLTDEQAAEWERTYTVRAAAAASSAAVSDVADSGVAGSHGAASGAATTSAAEAPNSEPEPLPMIRPWRMRVKLYLPASFFVMERGTDIGHCDVMYPPVTPEQARPRVEHQLECPCDVDQLLDALMTGAATLRLYESGCPPPAAIRPIRPPMREDTQLIYTAQHPMSEAAQAVCEEFVEPQIRLCVDEPTRAHLLMPVFTQPKPGTGARRALFDDSFNNQINMIP